MIRADSSQQRWPRMSQRVCVFLVTQDAWFAVMLLITRGAKSLNHDDQSGVIEDLYMLNEVLGRIFPTAN